MKTDDLIAALATNAGPAPRAAVARRLAPAMLFGVLASSLLSIAVLVPLGDRPLPGQALGMKLGYACALAASAAWLTGRLARPAAPFERAARCVAAVVILMGILGLVSLLRSEPGARWTAALGHSWLICPWAVVLLSVPGLAGMLWALHGLAPTRPRLAGFAAGLAAGALGAAGYAISCSEDATSFIALWYTLGIALAGALGAMLGPRWLRW
jgi:hypothetical protein